MKTAEEATTAVLTFAKELIHAERNVSHSSGPGAAPSRRATATRLHKYTPPTTGRRGLGCGQHFRGCLGTHGGGCCHKPRTVAPNAAGFGGSGGVTPCPGAVGDDRATPPETLSAPAASGGGRRDRRTETFPAPIPHPFPILPYTHFVASFLSDRQVWALRTIQAECPG